MSNDPRPSAGIVWAGVFACLCAVLLPIGLAYWGWLHNNSAAEDIGGVLTGVALFSIHNIYNEITR